jgi:HEAT repeat protein
MKKRTSIIYSILSVILVMGLSGCSRTVDDIAKWKAKGRVEKLIRALEDPKPEVRQAASDALGELKAGTAVDPLAGLFDDTEATVVLSAVKAMVSIGSEPAASHLILALKLANADARAIAAGGLGELKTVKAVGDLIDVLDDDEDAVACIAATSLGQIAEESASAALAKKLKSSSNKLRLASAEALGHTGGNAAAKGLIGALADKNDKVRTASINSLTVLGSVSTPHAIEALKNDHQMIRSGAIAVLKKQDALPTEGSDLIWLQLARVSVDKKKDINQTVVRKLAGMGNDAVATLLKAAAHNVVDFREHAFRALETIGETCTAEAAEAATSSADPDGLMWFNGRPAWNGAPSWRLDLWAAVAALNPDFELDAAKAANMQAQGRNAFRVITAPDFEPTREYVPMLIALLGDKTVPPPEQPDVDQFGMPVVKKAVDRFRGEANQQMAKEKLLVADKNAVFPLIAAVAADDVLVAGHAAEILGELGDLRASEPLMVVADEKIATGEQLTTSQLYAALQKLDDPSTESVLLKIRPNSDRAIRIFERQYPSVRAMSAESRDLTGPHTQPISFRIGFIDSGKMGELHITFAKNGTGEWQPTPPLPDELP